MSIDNSTFYEVLTSLKGKNVTVRTANETCLTGKLEELNLNLIRLGGLFGVNTYVPLDKILSVTATA